MRSNSVSSVSSTTSRAASTEPEETMQIFVKNIAGETFPMTVPASITSNTLRSLLALRTNLPESELRLVHAGKHIPAGNAPLSTAHIGSNSVLHLALPLRGGAPKKARCEFKSGNVPAGCREAAQRIVGDCGFCAGHFCAKHRMLESHNCPGLEDCKQEEKDRNKQKLESERTVAIKGI